LFFEAEQRHKSADSRPWSLRQPVDVLGKLLPGTGREGHLTYRQMADRTRPIVRPRVMDSMVTKGYRKGVYERVTNGTGSNSHRLLRTKPYFDTLARHQPL